MEKIITSRGVIDIHIPAGMKTDTKGELALVCPICSDSRKDEHKNMKVFSVNMTKDPKPWRCNHCGEAGYVIDEEYMRRTKIKPILDIKKTNPFSAPMIKWFWEERRISEKTLNELKITMSKEIIRQTKVKPGRENIKDTLASRSCINFRYFKEGVLINIKFRDQDKNFKMITDATKIMYNLDSLKGQKKCVIVEGEIDVASYHEAGIHWCVSVPNGVAITESEKEEYKKTGKFRENLNMDYLDLCIDEFRDMDLIYIATDDDIPGLKLREELSRRLGKERCKYVKFSEYTKESGLPCKDANDVLIAKGKDFLARTLEYAYPFPVAGVTTAIQYWDKMESIFDNGRKKGFSTGYRCLDPHFNWMPGWLTMVNGYPGEGKSSWIFNMVITSTILYGWKWGMYCPENYPPENIIDTLAEILVGDTADISFKDRMSKERYKDAIMKHIDKHFFFVDNEDGYTPAELRKIKKFLISQHGIRGFLTDPWKNLSHNIGNKSIDMYLQEELSAEVRLSVKNDLINLICHHPPTPPRDKDKNYPPPTQFELIGGQVWASTCYSMICIHKHDRTSWENTEAEVHVQRNKEHKLVGFPTDRNNPVLMKFERRTNRFLEREVVTDLTTAYNKFPFKSYINNNQAVLEGF